MAISDLLKRLKKGAVDIATQYRRTAESQRMKEATQKRLEQITRQPTIPEPITSALEKIKLPKITYQETTRQPIISPESETAKLIESAKKAGEEVKKEIINPTVSKALTSVLGTEKNKEDWKKAQDVIRSSELSVPNKVKYTLLNTLRHPSMLVAKRADVIENVLGHILKSQPRLEGESDTDYAARLQQGSDVIAEKAVKKFNLPEGLEIPIAIGLGLLIPGPGELFKSTTAVDELVKASNKADVEKIIRKTTNVPANKIDEVSELIAKTTNKTEIQDIVRKNIGEATKKIKPTGKERGFIETAKKEVPELKTKVSGYYIPRSTDELAIKARNLIKDDIELARNVALKGTGEESVATASELIKHYSSQASKATDKAVADSLWEKASEIAHETATKLTEQGRTVQAASILGRMTPEGQIKFAAKEINKYNEMIEKSSGLFGLRKKIPQLTGEQAKSIKNKFDKITNMPDGIEKARAFRKLQYEIAEMIPSKMYDKIISVWKAGLLTGMKTSGLNTFSNLFHGTSEIIKDIPATAVDSVSSLFTKQRTKAFTIKGAPGGLREGFNKGIDYLKTGFDERNIGAKLDYKKVNFGKSKTAKGIQKYEETVFRVLGAEDQPFYYGAKARSIYSQAIAEAKTKGLKGKEFDNYVDNLIKNPTDKMLVNATNDAEIAVFQNETALGKAARQVQKLPGGELFVPFGRTPASVATQIINYSPVGIVKTIASNIGKGKFNQKAFSEGLGRGITGTGVMFLGKELFKNNMVTLDYPRTEKERKLWEAEGRKPNSIKLGNKYRDVNVLGPAGIVLLAGGYYQRALEEGGSPIKAISEALAGMGSSIKEQTFLQGVKQVMDALNDPSRFAEGYTAGMISSIIPTIFGDIAKTIDPFQRRATGVLGRFVSKIPGARETLEPRVNVLGEEVKRAGTVLETLIDPSRPTTDIETPVTRELRRLFDMGYNATPTQLGDKEGYESLTPEQNTMLWQDTGKLLNQKLTALFNTDRYADMPDDKKSDIVKDFVQKSNDISRANIILETTQDLKGEDLKAKLSQYKEDGLMTRAVFNLYMRLR